MTWCTFSLHLISMTKTKIHLSSPVNLLSHNISAADLNRPSRQQGKFQGGRGGGAGQSKGLMLC